MEEALVKRVLPHSVEAEQSVIGAMLMDRDAIIAASETVAERLDESCAADAAVKGFAEHQIMFFIVFQGNIRNHRLADADLKVFSCVLCAHSADVDGEGGDIRCPGRCFF